MASNFMHSISTWKGGVLFEHVPPSGVTYTTDARVDGFPKEKLEGPGPMEMLLGALAGCTGIDVVTILSKMRLELKSLRIEVDAERREGHPRVFRKIHVTYHVETEPEDLVKVQRAVDLSARKYCSVSGVLAASAEMTYTLRHAGKEIHGVMHPPRGS
jgi:putative redox protein